jgi:hypothetical protein
MNLRFIEALIDADIIKMRDFRSISLGAYNAINATILGCLLTHILQMKCNRNSEKILSGYMR